MRRTTNTMFGNKYYIPGCININLNSPVEYDIQPPKMILNFDTGWVLLSYLAVPYDEDGYRMIRKILVDEHPKKGKNFYVKDLSKDFHTKYGTVSAVDIQKACPGDLVKNNRDNESFTVLEPQFIDRYRCIRRGAQIMSIKDLGYIIARTGIGKDSIVIEAGAGSGGCCCMIARVAGKVYSFDVNQENLDLARLNASDLLLDNIDFSLCDVYEAIPVDDVDVIILDVTEPWRAIGNAHKALKTGGFLVSYSPCITQTQEFINSVRDTKKFLIEKNIDILERAWAVDGKKVRPVSGSISHTGFISIVRKLR